MSQKRLADLLGVSATALSKSLRGLRQGGVPRYMRLVILCWQIMTPAQRKQVLAELDAAEEKGPDAGS